MPGRREHHIPQALLRGFATPTGKRLNVWLYRRGSERASNTNIRNVGVEVDFYTASDSDPFDLALNQLEGDYGAMLARIRSGADAMDEDLTVAKRFLAHCLVRTARVRSFMGSIARGTQEIMRRLSGDTELFRDVFALALRDEGGEEKLLDVLRSECERHGQRLSDEVLRPMLRQRMADVLGDIDHHAKEMTWLTRQVVDKAMARFDAKTVHMQALARAGLEPKARIEQIKAQPFGIIRLQTGKLLLSDCVVIGISKTDLTPCDGMSSVDELAGWIMPLSAMVFAYSGSHGLANMDARVINSGSVRLSEQFFLSQDRSDELQGRTSEIGTAPNVENAFLWEDLYEEISRDARAGG